MKKFFPFLLFIAAGMLLFFSCSKENVKSEFTFTPQKPVPGGEITVTFNADSTKLAGADSIDMVVYLYSIDPDNAIGVKMQKQNGIWTGKFNTSDTTRGALIKFVDASTEGEDNEVIANNKNKGFVIHLYSKNGDMVPGSMAGLASAVSGWAVYYLRVDKNEKLADEYYKDDFMKNPGIKNDYLTDYLSLETSLHKDKQDSIINAELAPIEAKKNKTEKELTLLVNWLGRTKNVDKENQYKEILLKKYPGSNFAQMQKYEEIYKEKDINKQLKETESFQKDFPNSRYLQYLYIIMVNKYNKEKDYSKAKDMLLSHKDKIDPYYFYKTVSTMVNGNANLNNTLELASTGVERAQAEVNHPSNKKSAFLTEKSWMEDREYTLAMNLYGEAMVLNKLNKNKDAETLLARALKFSKGEEDGMNELYSKVLIANSEYEEALNKIEYFIKSGKSTKAMDGLLKEAYVKKNGSDAGFDKLLNSFNSKADEKLAGQIKSQMLNEPAPDFTLTNLKGQKVSLKDLKGKIVVVDFWATWCGPCVSSFPAMETVIKKFSGEPNVKFLFVNTWENVKDKKENAEKFIEKNKYPFEVLLDTENKVVGEYHVAGIPTKFFIDKNGNIRFKSVGYSGNDDQMVKEISTVIAMLNKS